MTEPAYDVIVTIGLDYGSSTTKVCYRIQSPDIDKNGVVKFSGENAISNGMLLDSVVYVAGDWQFLSLNKIALSEKVRYIKTDLTARYNESKNIDTHKRVCSYYLSYVIGKTREYIEKYEAKILSKSQVLWLVNLGVPVDHDGIELHKIYEEMIRAAILHHTEASQFYLISFKRWQSYYDSSKEMQLKDMHYHLTPELLAEVTDVFEDPEVDEGLSMIVDVGSATVDIAVVGLDRHSSDNQHNVDFIAAKVCPLGVDNTVHYIKRNNDTNSKFPIKKALMEKSLFTEVVTLMRNHSYKIHSMEKYGNNLVEIFYGVFADLCLQVKSSSSQKLFSDMDTIPLYLLGAGNSYNWYNYWPEAAHLSRLSHSNVPKCDLQSLYHLPEIKSLDKELYHRFRVASGLLRIESMLKVTGYPKHFRVKSYSNKKINLHELLEARMSEKYGR